MTASRQAGPGRVVALDALRGVAVGGIALMNVLVFALPAPAYFNPRAGGGAQGADLVVWAASYVLVDNSFRGLFAMLFGAGCLILYQRARHAPVAAHYMRMGVLFLIGMAHAIVLANNDILRLYAMCGLVLPFLFELRTRALLMVSAVLMAAHVLTGSLVSLPWLDSTGPANAEGLLFAERVFGADPQTLAWFDDRAQESFGERVDRRLEGALSSLATMLTSALLNLSAMALGMAAWRCGLLQGTWPPARLRRLGGLALAAGAVPLTIVAAWLIHAGFPAGAVGAAALFWTAPFDLSVSLAYAAIVMLAARSGGWLSQKLAAAGRMALTNYIATSVIFALLFYAWGAGLYGAFGRAELSAIACLPMIGMLVWSPPWLARFGQGPLEWLWRRASAGTRQAR